MNLHDFLGGPLVEMFVIFPKILLSKSYYLNSHINLAKKGFKFMSSGNNLLVISVTWDCAAV